jgi:hypothetical protein
MYLRMMMMTTSYLTNQVLLLIVIHHTWTKEDSQRLSVIWCKQRVALFLKGQLGSSCLLVRLRHAPFNL